MTGVPQRQWADWPERPPDRHPDTLMWISIIKAVRQQGEYPVVRYCAACGETKPITEFARSPSRGGGGRAHHCKTCKSAYARTRDQQRKAAVVRAILGRAS